MGRVADQAFDQKWGQSYLSCPEVECADGIRFPSARHYQVMLACGLLSHNNELSWPIRKEMNV
jgi:hypothetical protein